MYFKKKVPQYLFDICTCFTCGECGGDKIFKYAQEHLKVDENGFSADGKFWIRQAECLAACDTSPVMQIANRRLVHKLTPEKFNKTVESLRRGIMPPFEPVAPQYDPAAASSNGNAASITDPNPGGDVPPPSAEAPDSNEEE